MVPDSLHTPCRVARLKPGDGACLRSIRLEALARYPRHFSAQHAEEAAHDVAWFEALIQTQAVYGLWHAAHGLIGTSCITPQTRPEHQHRAKLRMVYIRPEHQGRGLSRLLLRHVLTYPPEGLEQITLKVSTYNQVALRLYQQCGFVEYGREPQALKLAEGVYYDHVLMLYR